MPRMKTSGPSALPGLMAEALRRSGLDQVEIAERTRALDPDGLGVAQTSVGRLLRGEFRDPSLRTLALVGGVLGVSLRQQLEALGFAVDGAPVGTRAASVARVLAAASADDLGRIERLLRLPENDKRAIDAALGAIEAR